MRRDEGTTQTNRSMPPSSVIPELAYADVPAAAAWLCQAFGFAERLRIGDHRAQLTFGNGAIVVVGGTATAGPPRQPVMVRAVMVRVADVDAHHARATAAGARVFGAPVDQPYGERQYSAEDLGGHLWTFSQTIADVDPSDWGGTLLAGVDE